MIRVEEADQIIREHVKDFGMETISFDQALGRVLAKELKADRDLPPYNRVTMDGIAIRYEALEKGIRSFDVKAIQAAGDVPVDISFPEQCIEIMTGASLPETTDTVISYEEVELDKEKARVLATAAKRGQNIHFRGKDKKKDEVLVACGQIVDAAVISIAASTGVTHLSVKKLPKTVIISTGDELVEIDKNPSPYQVRRSNNYMIKAVLKRFALEADLLHLPDAMDILQQELKRCIKEYDVIILSGGVSMGKFDYVPKALEELSVGKLFHKVQQRPGKPFWFGVHKNGPLVFAFPGNPVSTFMCLHRYFLPWLKACTGISSNGNVYAVLAENISFESPLQYFLQVKLSIDKKGQLMANPVAGNGSGDFANLTEADAFMELPLEQNNFTKGEVFRIWPFKNLWQEW